MEALQRVKLDGFHMAISELEVEQDEESFGRWLHLALQALFA
jgi:hypothetical protein